MKRITKAFSDLRKIGYEAHQNFSCCQSCGVGKIKNIDKYVFYHKQDRDNLVNDSFCFLAWNGNGEEIVDILINNGIQTQWDGSKNTRIKIIIKEKNNG